LIGKRSLARDLMSSESMSLSLLGYPDEVYKKKAAVLAATLIGIPPAAALRSRGYT
jgi:hypothetical protein